MLKRTRRVLITIGALSVMGCSGAVDEAKIVGPDTCAEGNAYLVKKVGPELDAVLLKQPLPAGPQEIPGCALVYTQVSEEMPGEVVDESSGPNIVDQYLAFSMPNKKGHSTVTIIDPAPTTPGQVLLSISKRDVTGNRRLEVIVQEDSPAISTIGGGTSQQYRGLRIFSITPGQDKLREIFSERLQVKTTEGLDLIPEWRTGTLENARAIFFEAAGTWRIFRWNEQAQTFKFDPVATAAKNPKPAAPAPKKEGEPSSTSPGEMPSLDLP